MEMRQRKASVDFEQQAEEESNIDGETVCSKTDRKRCDVLNSVFLGCFLVCVVFLFLCHSDLFHSWMRKTYKIDKSQVESVTVFCFLIIPFTLAGFLYSWKASCLSQGQRVLCLPLFKTAVYRSDLIFWTIQLVIHSVWLGLRLVHFQQSGKLKKSGILKCTAKALGFNSLLALCMLLIPATRRMFCCEMIGFSYERSIKYHRWLGTILTVLLGLHGLLYWWPWLMHGKWAAKALPCRDCSSKESYKSWRNFHGALAFFFCLIIQFSSTDVFQKLSYRWFYKLHHLAIVMILCSSLHYENFQLWFYPSLVFYSLHRCRSYFDRTTTPIVSCYEYVPGYIRLVLQHEHFKAGQFVYIRIPSISRLDWHPFSISSSPLRSDRVLSLDIRVEGTFTMELRNRIGMLQAVDIDGYYGSGVDLNVQNLVLIAGGIGATPLLGILEHIVLLRNQQVSAGPKTVVFVWVCRDIRLIRAWNGLFSQCGDARQIQLDLYCTGDMDAAETTVSPPPLTSKKGFFERSRQFELLFTGLFIIIPLFTFQIWTTLPLSWWILRIGNPCSVVLGSAIAYFLSRTIQEKCYRPNEYTGIPSLNPDPVEEGLVIPSISSGRPDLKRQLETWHDKKASSNAVVVSGPDEMVLETKNTCARLSPAVQFHVKSFQL